MPAQAAARKQPTCNAGQFTPGHLLTSKSPAYKQPVSAILEAIDQYLIHCDNQGRPPTVPGIAASLGFTSRQALWRFVNESAHMRNGNAKKRQTIIDAIKKAKLYIEDVRVSDMVAGKGSAAGAIFDLKNNFGYIDKVEQVQDTHITVTWEQPAMDVQAEEAQGNQLLLKG